MDYNTNITTPIRRSARIAELNTKKEMELENYDETETTKENTPRRYTCMQKSLMIADLTMALVNLALILHRLYA